MGENGFLDDRAIVKNIKQSILYEKIISWLNSEKEVRIIDQSKPFEIKFMYEKTFGFYEGFGKPFLITLSHSAADIEVRIQVPFPISHYPEFFTRVKPLMMYLALEDIYTNIGVELGEDVLRRVFPKPALKDLIRSSIEGTVAAIVVGLATLCAIIYAFGLPRNDDFGYLVAVVAILLISFTVMILYSLKSNDRYRRYKALMKQLYD